MRPINPHASTPVSLAAVATPKSASISRSSSSLKAAASSFRRARMDPRPLVSRPDDFDNPQNYDFGDYQEFVRIWWRIFLDGADEGAALLTELANRGFVVLDCAELSFCP